MKHDLWSWISLFFLGSSFCLAHAKAEDAQWPTYGGDPGGQRFTSARQITPANVTQLTPTWVYHTGATGHEPGKDRKLAFEATPILFRGLLYLATPYDEVVALDPGSGKRAWIFDPNIAPDPDYRFALYTSRGVAAWPQGQTTGGYAKPCSSRIFVATLDRRLIAVDAKNGQKCNEFGNQGEVDLSKEVFFQLGDKYRITSPPTVVGNVVVVGSLVPDNQRVDIESGLVRAFDVHDGHQVWAWEPLPWAQHQHPRTGAGNAWSVFAADSVRHIVYIPTGSPSPDFYGGLRPGDNRDANSVVALDAQTGRRLWGFQVVHHDVWDYDVAAQPLLFDWHGADGKQNVPAIVINTKQGLVFVLNRVTGEPLFPVDEKPVPKSNVSGEMLSPTQPFQRIDSLSPLLLDFSKQLGGTAEKDKFCRHLLSGLNYEGIYTPPSTKGSLAFPGNLGGVNWGSASIDPATGILYANTNRYAYSLRLVDREDPAWKKRLVAIGLHKRKLHILLAAFAVLVLLFAFLRKPVLAGLGAVGIMVTASLFYVGPYLEEQKTRQTIDLTTARMAEHFGREVGPQFQTPYVIHRVPLIYGDGSPCVPQPWGTVSAVNLNTGKVVWQTPLGTNTPGEQTGTVNLGGDIVTASGLIFTAASENALFRAFSSKTGKELWSGKIPAPGQATPMSYMWQGKQYVVIAAGGHSQFGTPINDALVAFALPN